MNTLHLITSLAELNALQSRTTGLPCLAPHLFEQHQPDAHWVLTQAGAIAAHCSLWWRGTAQDLGKRLGYIGHYDAQNSDVASELLQHACEHLKQMDCEMAIAPIDGNTWRRYRALSDRGSVPLFFLEPDNPDAWNEQFQQAGFVPLAEYFSALNTDLTQRDPRLETVEARLQTAGVTVRSLDLQHFETELTRIFHLSEISFRHNFLYTPIDLSEFLQQYAQVKPYVKPELVLLAEHDRQLVGFLFATPDWLQAQRGDPLNTLVIKTVAVMPGRMYAGLGNVLVARVQAIAHQLGYSRAIHALMHEQNNSRNLSDRYAKPFRRYTLYAKPLLTRTDVNQREFGIS